jgi:hypothetical protein
MLQADGAIFLAGGGTDPGKLAKIASVRRIDGLIPSDSRLGFGLLPANGTPYSSTFSVIVTLTDQLGSASAATAPITVVVAGADAYAAQVFGSSCIIGVGLTGCEASGIRARPKRSYNPLGPSPIDNRMKLAVSSDGFVPSTSAEFTVAASSTTTTIVLLSPQPLEALSSLRYRVDVRAPLPPGIQEVVAVNSDTCVTLPSTTHVMRLTCIRDVRAPSVSIDAGFSQPGYATGAYTASTATPLTLPVAKATPSIVVESGMPSTARAGEYFPVFARVLTSAGLDVWPDGQALQLLGSDGDVLCPYVGVNHTLGDDAIDPHSCSARIVNPGPQAVTFSNAGDDQILPMTSTAQPITIIAAYGTTGTLPVVVGTTPWVICGTTPGLTCTVVNQNFRCDAPKGWQGKVYAQQSGYRLTGNGAAIGPLVAIEPNLDLGYPVADPACSLDINGDGVVDAASEVAFVIRALLGYAVDPSFQEIIHACATATVSDAVARIDAARASLAWDLDGDGEVRGLSDGLMLLRLALGISGNAVLNGAANPAGTRKTYGDVAAHFQARCGSPAP